MAGTSNLMEFLIVIGIMLLLIGGFLFANEKKAYDPILESNPEHEKNLKIYTILMGVGGGLVGLGVIYIIYVIIKYKKTSHNSSVIKQSS